MESCQIVCVISFVVLPFLVCYYWIHDAISCMGVPCTVIVIVLIFVRVPMKLKEGLTFSGTSGKLLPQSFL